MEKRPLPQRAPTPRDPGPRRGAPAPKQPREQSLSPSLRTYVSENPNADIATLKYMEEQRIKDNLAAQEMRQQLDALREQVTQMRQKPTTQERMNMVKAIVTEISNLCKLGVFSLEVMEDSSNPISTKFVLKVKRKADGSYDKHKARLR